MSPPAGIGAGDVRLAKFDPLPRVLFFDDFDEGINGWCELVSNHDNNLDNIRPLVRDLRPAQLSTCTFFDIGTHGSVDGVYSLKLATRPRVNHGACHAAQAIHPADVQVVQEQIGARRVDARIVR